METIKRNKNRLLLIIMAFALIAATFAVLLQNTTMQAFASSDMGFEGF